MVKEGMFHRNEGIKKMFWLHLIFVVLSSALEWFQRKETKFDIGSIRWKLCCVCCLSVCYWLASFFQKAAIENMFRAMALYIYIYIYLMTLHIGFSCRQIKQVGFPDFLLLYHCALFVSSDESKGAEKNSFLCIYRKKQGVFFVSPRYCLTILEASSETRSVQ